MLKLALTSPTSGGRSVGIVRWRTIALEFVFVCMFTSWTRTATNRDLQTKGTWEYCPVGRQSLSVDTDCYFWVSGRETKHPAGKRTLALVSELTPQRGFLDLVYIRELIDKSHSTTETLFEAEDVNFPQNKGSCRVSSVQHGTGVGWKKNTNFFLPRRIAI
jgi:hypothetical protein